jgi:hypothetical protein
MSEMVNESNNVSQSQPSVSSPAPAATPSHAEYQPAQSQQQEKLLKQSEVNEIVGRAKHEAIERYKRSNETQQPQQSQQQHAYSMDEVKRAAAEEVQRLRNEFMEQQKRTAQEQDATRVANEFLTKLSTGKEKYEDFDKVVDELELQNMPHIVQLANMVDNTRDVMYDLAKYPSKIANLHQLANLSPNLAYKEMLRLSNSIKENEKAAETKLPNEPLSQLKPTNNGTDNGTKQVGDYKRQYRG